MYEKTGISGFKPRITQESIKILISTVVLLYGYVKGFNLKKIACRS